MKKRVHFQHLWELHWALQCTKVPNGVVLSHHSLNPHKVAFPFSIHLSRLFEQFWLSNDLVENPLDFKMEPQMLQRAWLVAVFRLKYFHTGDVRWVTSTKPDIFHEILKILKFDCVVFCLFLTGWELRQKLSRLDQADAHPLPQFLPETQKQKSPKNPGFGPTKTRVSGLSKLGKNPGFRGGFYPPVGTLLGSRLPGTISM